uniref:Uncharacterized protein n=1 Tax=viral metagenome TaxID=1070528 RepID=A0A6C0IUH5_9ZZZZ
MVKRTHKRKQRGGDWYNPASWFSSSTDPYAPKKSWADWWSSTTGSAEASLASASESISSGAQNMVSSANNYLSQDINVSGNNPTNNQIQSNPVNPINNQIQPNPVGGKRRKSRSKSKSYKGGKGLGITYYATPITGIKTAQPNYWIKGGKKSKRKCARKVKKTRRYIK